MKNTNKCEKALTLWTAAAAVMAVLMVGGGSGAWAQGPDSVMVNFSVADGSDDYGTVKAYVDDQEIQDGDSVKLGAKIVFIASPIAGYEVDEWEGADVSATEPDSATLTVASSPFSGDTTITVSFKQKDDWFKLEFSAGSNGTIKAYVDDEEITTGSLFEENIEIVFIATPDANYVINEWTNATAEVTNNDSAKVEITQDTAVSVSFKEKPIDSVQVNFEVKSDHESYGMVKAYVEENEISSGDSVAVGTKIVFVATPETGYEVDEWDGADVVALHPDTAKLTVATRPDGGDTTVTVSFKEIPPDSVQVKFSVETSSTDYGSVKAYVEDEEIDAGDSVAVGTEIVFVATPKDGYEVDDWIGADKNGTHPDSATLTVADRPSTGDTTVTVSFTRKSDWYMLEFSTDANGSIKAYVDGEEVDSGALFENNTEVAFIATPESGYEIETWTNATEVVGTDSAKVTLSQDTVVSVTFKEIESDSVLVKFSVATGSEGKGTVKAYVDDVEISDGDSVSLSDEIVFVAVPETGYEVDGWSGAEKNISHSDSATLTVGTRPDDGDTLITVSFKQKDDWYMLGFSAGDNGSIKAYVDDTEVDSGSLFATGTEIVFIAEPETNYEIDTWTNATGVENTDSAKVTLTQDTVVSVTFKSSTPGGTDSVSVKFNVAVGSTDYGSVKAYVEDEEIDVGDSVAVGTEIVFIATPKDGYEVDEWTGADKNGTHPDSATLTVSTKPSTGDTTVTVSFTRKSNWYMLGFSAGANGSIKAYVAGEEVDSGALFANNTEVAFIATPESGYEIETWTNATKVVDTDSAKVTLTQDTVVSVTFKEIESDSVLVKFGVADGSESRGSVVAYVNDVEISDGDSVALSDEIVFIAVPKEGYEINEWKGADATVGMDSATLTVSTRPSDGDTVVSVSFSQKTDWYKLTFSADSHGSIKAYVADTSVESETLFYTNTEIAFIATADGGYKIKEWTNATEVEDTDSAKVTLSQDTAVSVSFESESGEPDSVQVKFGVASGSAGRGTVVAYVGDESLNRGDSVAVGDEILFIASPVDGYEVENWVGADVIVAHPDSAKLTMNDRPDNGDTTVTVSFKQKDDWFKLTFSVTGGNGDIKAYVADTNVATGTLFYTGTEVTFVAIPDGGYEVNTWSKATAKPGTDSATVTLTQDTTVSVSFKEETLSDYIVVCNDDKVEVAYGKTVDATYAATLDLTSAGCKIVDEADAEQTLDSDGKFEVVPELTPALVNEGVNEDFLLTVNYTSVTDGEGLGGTTGTIKAKVVAGTLTEANFTAIDTTQYVGEVEEITGTYVASKFITTTGLTGVAATVITVTYTDKDDVSVSDITSADKDNSPYNIFITTTAADGNWKQVAVAIKVGVLKVTDAPTSVLAAEDFEILDGADEVTYDGTTATAPASAKINYTGTENVTGCTFAATIDGGPAVNAGSYDLIIKWTGCDVTYDNASTGVTLEDGFTINPYTLTKADFAIPPKGIVNIAPTITLKGSLAMGDLEFETLYDASTTVPSTASIVALSIKITTADDNYTNAVNDVIQLDPAFEFEDTPEGSAITVTPPSPYTFTTATYGYSAQTPQTFTITSVGKEAITGMTATLDDGTNFEISTALDKTGLDEYNGTTITATVSVQPKTGLNAGEYADTLVIASEDFEDTVKVGLLFTVNKASAPSITWPSSTPITYGAQLRTSDLTGGSVGAGYGTFAWTKGDTIPVVKNSGYEVTFIDTNSNYDWTSVTKTQNVAITVNKASGLVATAPDTIMVSVGSPGPHTFDLSTIGLNKNDVGELAYEVTTFTDAVTPILDDEPEIDDEILTYTGAGEIDGIADLVVTIKSDNYTDIEVTITFKATDKTAVTISGLTAKDTTYDGTQHLGVTGTATISGGTVNPNDLVYTYSGGSISGTTTIQPKDAGTYTLTVSVPSTDVTYTGSSAYSFTIAKKDLILTAKDTSVAYGSSVPTLTSYIVEGIVDDEDENDAIATDPTLTCPAFDGFVAGTYAIEISGGTATDNYYIKERILGMLTVKDKIDVSGSITFPDGSDIYTGLELTYETATINVSGFTQGANPGTMYTYVAEPNSNSSLGPNNKPLTAGTYIVTATYEDDDNKGEATATFTIKKATPTVLPIGDANLTFDLSTVTFNGSPQGIAPPTAKSPMTGLGAVTVYYAIGTASPTSTAPTDAGIYAVTADIVEGDNFAKIAGLSLGDYVINKATTGLAETEPVVIQIPSGTTARQDVDLSTIIGLNQTNYGSSPLIYGKGAFINNDNILHSEPEINGTTLSYTGTGAQAGEATFKITITSDNYEDIDVLITFEATPTVYLINITPNGYGSAFATPWQAVAGAEVTLTAAPDQGYRFVRWETTPSVTFTTGDAETSPATFEMPEGNVEVTVMFEQFTYGISAAPPLIQFPQLIEGDPLPNPVTVTITNSGTGEVTLTHPVSSVVASLSGYSIGALGTTTLAANGTTTFTVQPKANLREGTYNEDISVNVSNPAGVAPVVVGVSLKVIEVPYEPVEVTYDPNGGSMPSPWHEMTGTNGKIALLPVPTRSGNWAFLGWYTARVGGNRVIDKAMEIEYGIPATIFNIGNTIIYAHWADHAYPVTFYPNNGERAFDVTTYYGLLSSLPNAPKRGNNGNEFAFVGWFTRETADGVRVTTSTVFDKSSNVYAHWQKAYMVTFDPNQTGTVTPEPLWTNENKKLSLWPVLPPEGAWKFDGWYTGPGNGAVRVTEDWIFTGDTKLFAHWILVPYEVRYSVSGGTVSPTSASVGFDGTLMSLPEPTSASGAVFDGWYSAPVGGVAITTATTFSASTDIYAHWLNGVSGEPPYTIRFDAGGGTPSKASMVTGNDGRLASLPTAVSPQGGYTLAGWYTSPTGGVAVSEGTVFGGDMTVYAHWTPFTVPGTGGVVSRITFNANGGLLTPLSQITGADGRLESLPTTSWAGHEFIDWFTEAAGGIAVSLNTVFTGDMTVYAHWKEPAAAPPPSSPTYYTITFDANGGTVSPTSAVTGNNKQLASLPTPTRSGYTFVSWYTERTGGVTVSTSTVYIANTTIYAHWTDVSSAPTTPSNPSSASYTITFNANGGTNLSPAYAVTGPDGRLSSLPTVTAPNGQTLSGWYTASSGGSVVTTSTLFTGPMTVYAQWTSGSTGGGNTGGGNTGGGNTGGGSTGGGNTGGGNTGGSGGGSTDNNMVTFNPMGGSVTQGTATAVNGKLSSLPMATRAGYTFDGWYTEASGGVKVVVNTTVLTPPTQVYAKWTVVKYTLSCNYNGGKADPANPTTYTVEDDITLTNPVRTAYTFLGWTGTDIMGADPAGSVHIPAGSVGNRSYVAKWLLNEYTIAFNADGGTGSAESGKTGEGGKLKSMPATPKKDGYSFGGWYTDASEEGVKVTTATVFDGDGTIYARWTPVSYSITYNLGGGKADNPTSYTIETAGFTLESPTRIGYEFAGWTGSNGTTAEMSVSVDYGTSGGSRSYTAKWTPLIYTITFDAGGGTVTPESGKTASSGGGRISSLPTPTKEDFAFNGWYTESMGGDKVTTSTAFDGDATIYAQWSAIYTVTFAAMGGSVSTPTGKTGAGGKLAALPTPTRAGYAFSGWFTEEAGGVKVTTSTSFSEDVTIYARWTPAYVVAFSAGEHGALSATAEGGPISTGASVQRGGSVVFTALPEKGYAVSGWTLNGAVVEGNQNAAYTLADLQAAAVVTVSFEKVSVAVPDRVVPDAGSDASATVIASVAAGSGGLTVGPNPIGKSSAAVTLYRVGSRVAPATLSVYDASGDLVANVQIEDRGSSSQSRRAVGAWTLTDKKGRRVPDGVYLLRGVVKPPAGQRELVSVVVDVR